MNLQGLERLVKQHMPEAEGSPGFWHGKRQDVDFYIVADEENDRMRIMSPIGTLRGKDADFLTILLRANFDRALDAKYALRKKEVWAVTMHPLSTLIPKDLENFLNQIHMLVKTTDSTYRSTNLVFGVDEDTDLDDDFETDEDDDDVDDQDDDEDLGGRDDDDPKPDGDPVIDDDDREAIKKLTGL